MEERFDIVDNGVIWGVPRQGKNLLELAPQEGGVFFRMERAKCGKFSELSALPEKFRLHRSEDGISAEVESSSVIPFGCEYRIEREWQISSRVAVVVSDFSAVNFGKVDGIELEPMVFCGEWKSVEILVFGDDKFRKIEQGTTGVVYSGEEPPLMIRVVFSNGMRCETALGHDVWRHRAASRIEGAHAQYELRADDDMLRLTRRVLFYDPEIEVERRTWRFTALVSWDDGSENALPDCENFEVPGCALSATVRREFRHRVRRAASSLCWSNVAPCVCSDPSHPGRSGKGEFEHFDLAEFVASWRWANRQLSKDGYKFFIKPSEDNIFADSVIMKSLSSAAAELD